jgi:AcrR family transcriptional regulator
MTTTADAPVSRGRPRDERTRVAILEAAAELMLEHGVDKVSMDAIAERAGASKATIYRWWPTKESLALDAVYRQWSAAQPGAEPTGSVRDDLVALLTSWSRLAVSRPYARVVAALVNAAQTDDDFAVQYRAHFVEPRRERGREILAAAVRDRQLPPGTDIELALDLLYGPIYHRLLHGHAPVHDGFVRGIVDSVCAGLAAGSFGRRIRELQD